MNDDIFGEGATKYFDKDEAKKHVHQGDNIKNTRVRVNLFYVPLFQLFPIEEGGSFVIEPYSLHQYNHQFGFHQDILNYLENDIRAELLGDGLSYRRIFISCDTMSKATFHAAITSTKKLHSTRYPSWWERSHGMFLEDKFKKLKSCKVSKKEVVHTSTNIEKCPQILFSSKKSLQETLKNNNDRCWKRQRIDSTWAGAVDLEVVEPNGAMYVLKGKCVVFNHKRKYILGLWEEICGRLSRTSLNSISSYKEDIYEIFNKMSEMNLLDRSPLNLVDSLFELGTSYGISSNKKSLKEVKQKLTTLPGEREELEVVLEAAKTGVEEIQAKILATKYKISLYENMNLLMADDSIHLEKKKEQLEASCQDLTNYKLCVDYV
ncbi:hypothetical protein R3W88_014667 [Solanum pinnatisectum]|uniref:Uncharacterized protein n=1 Tax=Solanum pinnatisectum TaxID=50273 RepID=A0AAV9KUR5_9SOLN|nr:hypothetical protein R3W88_014667 [Solanum pinnatisectum]